MSISVTLKEIIDCRDSLISLSQQRLNIKTGYNISKIIRFINKELEILTKIRQDIVDRLAPQGTNVTPEINQAILTELNEALAVEVEIPVNKIDLSNISNIELSAKDIMLLDPFCIFETTNVFE